MSKPGVGKIVFALALAAAAGAGAAQPAEPADSDMVGLWEAKRIFGPEVKGLLLILRRDGRLVADIAGFTVPVTETGATISFALPDDRGSFRGRIEGGTIRGFWTQPASATSGMAFSTPLILTRFRLMWRGEVRPLEERVSYYLPVRRADDGTLRTFLRNPERNQGVFIRAEQLKREGDKIELLGRRRGRDELITLLEGRFDADRASFSLPGGGGTYDFSRVDGRSAAPFYPRGPAPIRYRYAPPPALDDGWPVGTLEEAGISRPAIEALIQKLIDAPMDGLGSGQVHSLLIARRGKLVVEEYFHGYDRDRPHDIRSAFKSAVATMVGAAIQSGVQVSEATPVYRTMLGTLPTNLDPHKPAMTLGNLLTMTGGHYCDDNDDKAPGNEDVMQDQNAQPDWYAYILALPMDRAPGEKIVYCSVDAHLAGGVLAKAAGEPLVDMFDRLIARPLQMGAYHLNLSPTGEMYGAGGSQFRPRDYMKLAQLMANQGVWNGRRIVSREWAIRSGSPLRALSAQQSYGYFWNSAEYPWRGKKVRAVFAAGNGGQIFMAIPELELVIAFTGGSYADSSALIPQRKLVPEEILPAVR